jgi:hypothetical protein
LSGGPQPQRVEIGEMELASAKPRLVPGASGTGLGDVEQCIGALIAIVCGVGGIADAEAVHDAKDDARH